MSLPSDCLHCSNTLSPDTEDDSFRDLIEHLSPPEKMAGLCWMAVVLAFSLSVGNTGAMDQNKVQKLAKYILNNCFLGEGQVSLAVNFPANLDQNSLHKISEECALIKDKIGQQDGLYKVGA
ncbi:uncharacterized protein LOC120569296 isoform X4 [Perca fluviatilis]|uniref:uncharacterized protein LOC120569296 isoform X4 n=1 Tax=Perca fluviatilis TaxID=8168 RepID=UPI0019631123|nr:uncharacterized protein LOC120569296 isoform X4 [Perca fluviatilis]